MKQRHQMLKRLELAPDYGRKRSAEARRLSDLIEDDFTAETLMDIGGHPGSVHGACPEG
jgi:hypothetical protein